MSPLQQQKSNDAKTVLTETELRKARAFLVLVKNLPWLMYHINATFPKHQHKELCLSLLMYKVCGYLSLLWCSVRDSPPRVKGGTQGHAYISRKRQY